jgi:hypothetical protein
VKEEEVMWKVIDGDGVVAVYTRSVLLAAWLAEQIGGTYASTDERGY